MKSTLITKALDDASSLTELLDTFSSVKMQQRQGKLVQEACLRLRTRLGLGIPSSARMATRNLCRGERGMSPSSARSWYPATLPRFLHLLHDNDFDDLFNAALVWCEVQILFSHLALPVRDR